MTNGKFESRAAIREIEYSLIEANRFHRCLFRQQHQFHLPNRLRHLFGECSE